MSVPRIRILIIDDDEAALSRFRQVMALYGTPEDIAAATDAMTVMELLKSREFDLVFIDMEMPDTDGFTIADYIRENCPGTSYVFLTGHVELGAKSYEYEPLDFLCKPLDALRLKKTFEKFEKSRTPKSQRKTQVAVESVSGFVLVSPEDILYIAREDRKTVIHCRQGDYIVKYALDELEAIFSDFDVFRIHQSYLVPLGRIESVAQSRFGKTYDANLPGGIRLPVSRGKYVALRKYLSDQGIPFV